MFMVATTYMNNLDLDHAEIVDLLTTGFQALFEDGGKNISQKCW